MFMSAVRITGLAAGFSALFPLVALADAPKCIDSRKNIEAQLDPLVDLAMTTSLHMSKGSYTLAISRFYAINETENLRDCVATMTLTTKDGLSSQTEVKYQVVFTEDKEVVTQLQDYNLRGLVAGIIMGSLGQAAKQASPEDLHAPQGPGSFADQMHRYNQRKSE